MSSQFNLFFIIILFSISLQDEISENFLLSLQNLKPDINMEIQISREYIKAKRQSEKSHRNTHIFNSMEHITVETFWRYPKPVLRKPESDAQEVEIPKKKQKQKQNVPNFMKPLKKQEQNVVLPKKEDKQHEVQDVELIVPGNLISVQEAQLERPVEDREQNYLGFLKKAKFLFNFLYVDLNKYRQYNYLQLGNKKKYHDFKLIDRKSQFQNRMFPNIQFWLYSQQEDFNFYTLRATIDNEYRFFNEFHQEQLIYENKGSFFGPRIGNCWNDLDIFRSYQKALPKFSNTNNIKINYKGQQFHGELKEVTNSKMNFLTIKIQQNENKQIKDAKREYIDYITTIQLSKQQLNQIGFLGRFNKDDKCYYDVGFVQESSDLELTFMFKIMENDWSKLNAVYRAHKENITNNCQVIQNEIYSNDYLGQRKQEMDLEVTFDRRDRNFYLKAYLQNDRINYLVVYDITRQYFLSENVYESVLTTLQKNKVNVDGCVYHNDNYFLDKDFSEVYMITFISMLTEEQIASFNLVNEQNQPNLIKNQSVMSFTSLYEAHQDERDHELNKSISSMHQELQNITMLKQEIKDELKQELKTEIVQELKQYFEHKKLI